MNFYEYTTKKTEDLFCDLKTSEKGLSDKESENRLKIYGPNEIKTKEEGLFDVFLRQLNSPFFYLLLIASIIAFFIGARIDSLFILIFITINVSLGFFQEARAQKAVSLLKKFLPSKVRILREKIEKIIDKKFLVPGDAVLLEPGDIVPADLRIIKGNNLLIDESVLTGESFPVSKSENALLKEAKEVFEAKNIAFAGTSIISGEGEGIVINTGKDAVLGDITKLVSEIKRESVYEKSLMNFSRVILKIVVLTIVFAFLANLAIKGTSNFFDFLIFSIALIVSIIPEALPLVTTFSLSEGALRLAKQKVVVKRLSAVEDLGNIEILCTDKTGTITENKLELENIFAKDKEKCLLYGLLTSPYVKEHIESGFNPFDFAVFQKTPDKIRKTLEDYKVVSEINFNPDRLRNSALLKDKAQKMILIVKGAPEAILKLSSKFEEGLKRDEIQKEIEREGSEGKRILAVAFKEMDKDYFSESDEQYLTFLGYFSFKDPLKSTTKKAIHIAEKMGVKIKIITGDSKEVAGKVAQEIGLIKNPHNVVTGDHLNSLSREDFHKACEGFSVFARISPRIKYKIIEALQKKHEVGFLGEGINDAPALKIANLAIAVDSAVDVCREVSDIILMEKDLNVIVEGIKQGRNIFSNINKYIKCTIASNFGNFYSILLISLKITFLPILPIQILLVNLLSDFPLISVATDQVDVEELRKPKLYQLKKMVWLIFFLALTSTIFDFIFFFIFYIFYKVDAGPLQTLWFIESILTEIALIFSIRTSKVFFKAKRPSFTLILLSILAIIVTISLPFTKIGVDDFHFVTPDLSYLAIILYLIVFYFVTSEIVKLVYFHYRPVSNNKNHRFARTLISR